jgi:hypothetical protein
MMRTKCEIVAEQARAMENWPDDMPADAASFESAGWALSFALAKRCEDPDCTVCPS